MNTILVVDRDIGFVLLLSQSLMTAGYQVVPASDFETGLSLVSELRVKVDLAFVEDALLPARGSSTLNALFPSPVPIILTSEAPRRMDRQQAAKMGVATALRKPKPPHRLPSDRWLTQVRNVLSRKDI